MRCYICKTNSALPFLSLGHQPPSDAFLRTSDMNEPETTYPLDLYFCPVCSLVQLSYAVDPEILFKDYVYSSGTNNSLKENFKELVDGIVNKYAPQKGALAIDIGSNDGTLLSNYLPYGLNILGIDPSSVAADAKEKGVPTIVDFFGKASAERALKEYGKAKYITATNVFAHVDDLDGFVEGISLLLEEGGVFITESGYVVDMVEGMQYDSIYHEHLRYYSVTALVHLFEKFEMEVIDVEHIKSHGGSIRVTTAMKGSAEILPSVKLFIEREKEGGYTGIAVYHEFAKQIRETKFKLLDIIYELKKNGSSVVGIGAPAKGNTLLNFCKLTPDMIDYLTEKSALKIGRFSPGMHIPVVDEAIMFKEPPDVAILLSWNIADELILKLRKLGYKGKFVLPNPEPKIIEN